jgi:replicative DNA helicase
MSRRHAARIETKSPVFDPLNGFASSDESSHNQLAHERALIQTLARTLNGEASSDPDKVLQLDGLRYRILATVSPEDFTRPDYRDLFEAIREVSRDGESVDAQHVGDRLRRSGRNIAPALMAETFEGEPLTDAATVDGYIASLTTRSRLRMVEVMARKVAEQARTARNNGHEIDVEGAVAKLQAVTFDAERTRRIVGEMSAESEAIPAFVKRIQGSKTDRGFVGWDTGFRRLSVAINGLQSGLYVIAAPAGAGKTTFAKQLADNVAKLNHVPVIYFTRDTSANDLRVMTLSRLAAVNTRCVTNGPTDREVIEARGAVNIWSKVEAAAEEYASFGHWMHLIETDLETTVGRIRLMAHAIMKKHGAHRALIVVDHLQALSAGADSRHLHSIKDRVDWVASELRRLARDLDCPIVAISSFNRAAYQYAPSLSAFNDAGGIEFGTDVVCVMHTRAKQSIIGDYFREVDLCILKNRFGDTTRVGFTFAADRARFEERPDAPVNIAFADSLKEAVAE